jgi:hypothetical protein
VSPDYLLVLMVPVALLSGRFVRFLGDWVPFIAVFLAYEAMRGLASKTGIAPHVGDLASAESWLFGGHMPSAVLQSSLHSSAVGGALDYLATVVYFCHFVVPLTVGLVIWLVDRTQFLRYTTALLGMACVAFVVFLLVPTAPPWYANDHGVISGVHKILQDTLPSAVSPYYQSLNPNPVAAMPSLHMAWAAWCALAVWQISARRSLRALALAYPCLTALAVMATGNHFALDLLAGLATLAAAALLLRAVRAARHFRFFRPVPTVTKLLQSR